MLEARLRKWQALFAAELGAAAAEGASPSRAAGEPASCGVDEYGSFVRLQFIMPKGAFATVVLRELMKNDVNGDGQTNETSDDS